MTVLSVRWLRKRSERAGPVEKRMKWINQIFQNDDKVKVRLHEGLTVDFCKEVKSLKSNLILQ